LHDDSTLQWHFSREEIRAPLHPMLRTLPVDLRPREHMLMASAAALTNAELVAIPLRTGAAGKSVNYVAENLHVRFDSLVGIA
jgi:DNA repair protein RadC